MEFPISGIDINPILLIAIGFLVGVLGGFFGVGGGFLAGPLMFISGVPMNFVVGTDLAHMVGKSIVASKRHNTMGNVDVKLGLFMVAGTMMGVEMGAQVIEFLEKMERVDVVVGLVYVVLLISLSAFVFWESRKSMKRLKRKKDTLLFVSFIKRVQRLRIPPMVSFPKSHIESISIWIVIFVGIVTGFLAGMLGVGEGFLRMPVLVYLLGVPTHVAVGTDLFEIVISASYGTLTHAIKGNVDILIALVMHTGAAIGAQIGAMATKYVKGPQIRMYFSVLPLAGGLLMAYKLLS